MMLAICFAAPAVPVAVNVTGTSGSRLFVASRAKAVMVAVADPSVGMLGALVTTTTFPLVHPAFELVQQFAPPGVAWTTVFLYRRRGALETPPPTPASYLYEQDGAAWEAAVRAAFAAHDAAQGG